MKQSRIMIHILVISFAFILFIAWDQHFNRKNGVTQTFSLVPYYEIYLITTDNQDQFWSEMNQGASDMAKLTNVNYYWRFPDERNVNKQIEVINQAIEDGAKALLVVADDPKRISGPIEDAKAKGIKVIYLDSPANEEAITTLATDNYAAGVTAGERMIATLKNKGIKEGSIGIINIKNKIPTNEREKGFRDALEKEQGYTLLPTKFSRSDPEEANVMAEKIIRENKDLVGLFGTNEGTTEGVGYANRDNDNRFAAIGFDVSDLTKQLFEEGSLNAIIAQNPYTMGYLGMAEAIASLLGKNTGPKMINTGYTAIEKE